MEFYLPCSVHCLFLYLLTVRQFGVRADADLSTCAAKLNVSNI
jgi:hypothetical protein